VNNRELYIRDHQQVVTSEGHRILELLGAPNGMDHPDDKIKVHQWEVRCSMARIFYALHMYDEYQAIVDVDPMAAITRPLLVDE
jgi:hypothetical protein